MRILEKVRHVELVKPAVEKPTHVFCEKEFPPCSGHDTTDLFEVVKTDMAISENLSQATVANLTIMIRHRRTKKFDMSNFTTLNQLACQGQPFDIRQMSRHCGSHKPCQIQHHTLSRRETKKFDMSNFSKD